MAQEVCFSKVEGYKLVKRLGLHETTLGYPKGAEKQYRDSRDTNTIHARMLPTEFCLHRDKYNPEQYPFEHFFADVLKPEAVLAGGLTCAAVKMNNKDWKTALKWGIVIGAVVQLIVDN